MHSEKPRIRVQTEFHVPWTCSPKEILQQCTTSTYIEAVHHHEVVLGSSILILTTKGSWLHSKVSVATPGLSPAL